MDTLLDTAPCGFLSLRDDGSIVTVNRTLLEWLGYASGELQGRHIDFILPAASRIFYQTHLFPLLRIHGLVEEVYFPLRGKDGSDVPMLVNAARRHPAPTYDCVFMRMKQRDRFENEILQAKAVAEQAWRAKEDAYAELEAFAYSVSHDLRTPLAVIRTFAEFALKEHAGRLDGQVQEAFRYIARSASEMATMIEDILAYSRTSASDLELAPVSLQNVVARAVEHLQAEFSRRDVKLDIQKPLPSVHGHPVLLEQAVANLLSNAAKYVAPNMRPAINVWSERIPGPQPKIRLWIEDNGIGIAPGDQERIFRLFERGHAQNDYAGTGIGLAIVRKGIERMGGSVGVESALGSGSRFWVELPETAKDSTGIP